MCCKHAHTCNKMRIALHWLTVFVWHFLDQRERNCQKLASISMVFVNYCWTYVVSSSLAFAPPHMHCYATGPLQSESTNSGQGKDEQPVSDCIVRPASLQTLPADGSRVSSQKKQPHLPRHQNMAPGQLMELLPLM